MQDPDHEANAAYFDQIAKDHAAQEQATNAAVQRVLDRVKNSLNELPVDHLRLAREQMADYAERVDSGLKNWDMLEQGVYEDRAYKRAMLHIGIAQVEAAQAQAEQLRRVANALERIHVWTGA